MLNADLQMTTAERPRRFLVTEDEALIALSLGVELSEAGCEVVGPFRTCADAEAWLAHDTPDFAILDIELADGICTAVALDLQRRGVPFAVFSGSMATGVPDVFRTAPWFTKPGDLRSLIESFAG